MSTDRRITRPHFTRLRSGSWWVRWGRLLFAWDPPVNRRNDGWVPLSVREGAQKRWTLGGFEVRWRVRRLSATDQPLPDDVRGGR